MLRDRINYYYLSLCNGTATSGRYAEVPSSASFPRTLAPTLLCLKFYGTRIRLCYRQPLRGHWRRLMARAHHGLGCYRGRLLFGHGISGPRRSVYARAYGHCHDALDILESRSRMLWHRRAGRWHPCYDRIVVVRLSSSLKISAPSWTHYIATPSVFEGLACCLINISIGS